MEALKTYGLRFLRGGLATALAFMAATTIPDLLNGNWNDLSNWLARLAFAGIIGLISGGILALDKYIRDTA